MRIEALRNRLKEHQGVTGDPPRWAVAARDALDQAEVAADQDRLDTGWRFAHVAEEVLVESLSSEELESEAISVREECAAKLTDWDRAAAMSLLSASGWKDLGVRQKQEHLRQALELLHRAYARTWFRHRVMRRQIMRLPMGMAALVVGLVVLHVVPLVAEGHLAVFFQKTDPIFSVVLMGLLGGSLSAFLSLGRTVNHAHIPDLLLGNTVTSVRIFFGGAAALAIYFALGTNLSELLFNVDFSQRGAILFFSFVAGFSERIVRLGVEKVGG